MEINEMKSRKADFERFELLISEDSRKSMEFTAKDGLCWFSSCDDCGFYIRFGECFALLCAKGVGKDFKKDKKSYAEVYIELLDEKLAAK